MKTIDTIHFALTPFQIRLLNRIRAEMPFLSEYAVQKHVASMGLLTIARKLCEDDFPSSIVIDISKHLDAFALLRERHPKADIVELVRDAMARGLLSMLAEDRDKDRERDGIPPLDDEELARLGQVGSG